ncbi:MAG: DUF418 domain-containing protein [Bacteroidales bacterium]|nr:DUF418 domain-containing protein [Bacteroidales bacterium]
MKTDIRPVAPGKRIEMLDTLRGLAIFGILMVNMQIFFKPVTTMLIGYTGTESVVDMIAHSFIKFFFEGKFYVLFSMLFGYGFWIFLSKSSVSSQRIIVVFRRRVLVLLIIGLFHVVLLWAGDILVFYALFGFLLILFRKEPDRILVKWSLWLAAIPVLLTALMVALITLAQLHPESRVAVETNMQQQVSYTQEIIQKATVIYSIGSHADIVKIRLKEYQMLLPGILFFYPMVLAMFLIGVWAARKEIISKYQQNLPFFRKALRWSLPIGLATNSLYVFSYFHATMNIPSVWSLLRTLSHTIGGFSFGVLYVSLIVVLTSKGKLLRINQYLASVGRMALTNYLLHSIICSTLFLSYGFEMFGKLNTLQGILLAVLIFLLQIPVSHLWLKHFNYGPFEWVWRCLTYMKWHPFLKKAIAEI